MNHFIFRTNFVFFAKFFKFCEKFADCMTSFLLNAMCLRHPLAPSCFLHHPQLKGRGKLGFGDKLVGD